LPDCERLQGEIYLTDTQRRWIRSSTDQECLWCN